MADTTITGDVVNYLSLGKVSGFEWHHLRKQCKTFQLDDVTERHCMLAAKFNAARFLIYLEVAMVLHIIVLFCLIQNLQLTTVVPYFVVMIFVPLVYMISMRSDIDNSNYFKVYLISSWLVAMTLTIWDILLISYLKTPYPLVPCFDHLILLSVYAMLPISFVGNQSIYLGISVSLVYFAYLLCMYTFRNSFSGASVIAYLVYLCFLNLVLIFFLLTREYKVRRHILTRFQLVYQNVVLKLVTKKENDLLESIFPRKMMNNIKEDICDRLQGDDNTYLRRGFLTRELFIEPYPEVTILQADMVNFTHLTTTLDASTLVQILHELFVSFDLAARKHRVTSIKFMGDAYNYVAGIPTYFPTHANSCVEQALEMIAITKDLGLRRSLKINLRVGVHSGEVFAGIIGRIRWHFDIWSNDVDITNRLEISGRPGMVHVSSKTLMLLDNVYAFEEVTEAAKQDPILQKVCATTYLISGRRPVIDDISGLADEVPTSSLTSYGFSLCNLYENITVKALRQMVPEVDRIPVGRGKSFLLNRKNLSPDKSSEEQLFNQQVHSLLPIFRTWNQEQLFHHQPDYLIKYSMLMIFIGGVMLFCMHTEYGAINSNTYVRRWIVSVPTVQLGLLLVLLLFTLIAFYKKLWLLMRHCKASGPPRFFISSFVYNLSKKMEESVYTRCTLILVAVMILYALCVLQLFYCDIAQLELEIIHADLINEKPVFACFLPWSVTYGVVVILFLLTVVQKLPLFIKLILGTSLVILHLITINAYFGIAFERSETTFMGLRAELAHTWYLLLFFIFFVLRERDLAYMCKSSFFVQLRYEDKVKQTSDRTHSMKIIMANMLPAHVTKVFNERQSNDQLYFENFDRVAVMFASIDNFVVDRMGLRLLHEFICFFDDLLATYQTRCKIEKIKVMGWTYMAACGLESDQYVDFSIDVQHLKALHISNGSIRFASEKWDGQTHTSHPKSTDLPVLVMVDFALGLLRIMDEIRQKGVFVEQGAELQGSLKIGISHGSVMAGVVGMSKPHFDLWGHPVNIASGITKTGVLDAIHVPRSTALVLREFNIRCNYRGMTTVKGVGKVPTYLVALAPNLEFQAHNPSQTESDESLEKGSRRFAPSVASSFGDDLALVTRDNDIEELEEEQTEKEEQKQQGLEEKQKVEV